jgi:hypothetical protein
MKYEIIFLSSLNSVRLFIVIHLQWPEYFVPENNNFFRIVCGSSDLKQNDTCNCTISAHHENTENVSNVNSNSLNKVHSS